MIHSVVVPVAQVGFGGCVEFEGTVGLGRSVGLPWQLALQDVMVSVFVVKLVLMCTDELRVSVYVMGHVVTVV